MSILPKHGFSTELVVARVDNRAQLIIRDAATGNGFGYILLAVEDIQSVIDRLTEIQKAILETAS